jgi:CelD/BcsL family acetyltransferase involved in cellulose biosynthesis
MLHRSRREVFRYLGPATMLAAQLQTSMASDSPKAVVGSPEKVRAAEPAAPARWPRDPVLSIVTASSWAELEPYRSGWDALAAAALEPNVFYESWMVKPALECFGSGKELLFVLVVADPGRASGQSPLVVGFFPLERRRRYKRLPVSALALWRYIHCYLCTPLVHASYARECLAAFFNWLATPRRGASLLECTWVPGEGPFHRLLMEHLAEHRIPSLLEECYCRALLSPRGSGQEYIDRVLSGERRRRLRKHEERLKQKGEVKYAALAPGDDARAWLEAFLRLEAAGWKGQEGTALRCREEDRRFFLDALLEAFQRGRLMMMTLQLAGRPVALFCDLLAEPWSFVFKLTFDEEYAAFSPGALLELEKIRRLHERPAVRWVDSCNAPGSSLLKHLWSDRRLIETILIAPGPSPGPFLVSLLPLLRWTRLRMRAFLRRFGRERPAAEPAGRGQTASGPTEQT